MGKRNTLRSELPPLSAVNQTDRSARFRAVGFKQFEKLPNLEKVEIGLDICGISPKAFDEIPAAIAGTDEEQM